MTSEELCAEMCALLKRYNEEDIDGNPVKLECLVSFNGVSYELNNGSFILRTAEAPAEFLEVVKEVEGILGRSIGYGLTYEENSIFYGVGKVKVCYMIVYGEAPPFIEYKGYKIEHRKSFPTFI